MILALSSVRFKRSCGVVVVIVVVVVVVVVVVPGLRTLLGKAVDCFPGVLGLQALRGVLRRPAPHWVIFGASGAALRAVLDPKWEPRNRIPAEELDSETSETSVTIMGSAILELSWAVRGAALAVFGASRVVSWAVLGPKLAHESNEIQLLAEETDRYR